MRNLVGVLCRTFYLFIRESNKIYEAMNKRIGILTYHGVNNYGAVLQAYGLCQVMKDLGLDVRIIDYIPVWMRNQYYPSRILLRLFIRPWQKVLSVVHKDIISTKNTHRRQDSIAISEEGIGLSTIKILRYFMPLIRIKRLTNFRKKFQLFRKEYLPLTEKKYLRSEQLSSLQNEFDCIFVGSDQVWNVNINRNDLSYFLNFLSNRAITKRVSYAASVGDTFDFGQLRESVESLLKGFSKISVRDEKSQDTISSMINFKPMIVLDPSLIADYDYITPPRVIGQPYVFMYFLQNPNRYKLVISILRDVFPYHRFITVLHPIKGARLINSGPLQWLSLIKHADFVCTDSFHGTCFAIKNKKRFVTLPINSARVHRIKDLLFRIKLADRFISDLSIKTIEEKIKDLVHNEIDYETSYIELDNLIDASRQYIIEAINAN